MNLPLFIDIALGLIFIFLTLSLLASELQELMSALLQWRAEHLKRSIELLLSGETYDDLPGVTYANRLYEHPLITTLNQEAQGPLAKTLRTFSQVIGRVYRRLTQTRNIFGRFNSGPSYIPAQSFAAAILADLNLQEVSHQRSWDRLIDYRTTQVRLIQELLEALQRCTGDRSLLVREFDELNHRLQVISNDLNQKRLTYSTALEQSRQTLVNFLTVTESVFVNQDSCREVIRRQVPYLLQAIAQMRAEPTLSEVIDQALSTLEAQEYVPEQLKQTLHSLAMDVQNQAESLVDGVNKMEQAVGTWFDRAMDRASGVYSRNAKGVALLIGLLIAVSTNTDTFYVVQRLSKDSILRSTLTQATEQVQIAGSSTPSSNEPAELGDRASTSQQLKAIRDAVDENLDDLPLPIGWNPIILQEQQAQASTWSVPLLRRPLGWLITAIAISMGASFWYGLLSKIVDVRSTGSDTTSDSQNQN
ncbi:MAG: hypothetical protein WBA57_00825 [Elainellaceae cyanobacterium]